MNGGHQALGDAEVVVQHLGDGSQAVGGAGSVGNKVHAGVIGCIVDAHHEHGGVILGGGAHDDLFGAGVQVALSLLLGQEQAGGLHNILNAQLAPGNLLGLELGIDHDPLAIDGDGLVIVLDGAGELTMHGVIAQHVGHVVGGHAGVVDAQELNVLPVDAGAEDQTADAAKTVDANFDAHERTLLFIAFQGSNDLRRYYNPNCFILKGGNLKFSVFTVLFELKNERKQNISSKRRNRDKNTYLRNNSANKKNFSKSFLKNSFFSCSFNPLGFDRIRQNSCAQCQDLLY